MKYLNWYFNTYKGLSKEIWIIAATLLINRSGVMVMTFLALYLIEDFNYSVAKAGFVVSFYGWGSLVGVWLGGILAEKIGYLKIQFLALLASGLVFISMFFANEYWEFILLSFLVSATADMFRPANMASIPWYSNKGNRKRSIALIRLAINLGISIGPALGGFLALSIGYTALFWVDGITCIVAALFLALLLGLKDPKINEEGEVLTPSNEIKAVLENPENKTENLPKFYWLLAGAAVWSFVFFQLIYTFPVFLKKELLFDEFTIGLFFTLNGLLIFFTEMPIIHKLQEKRVIPILNLGIILCAISFVFLASGKPEMLVFPFMYILFITYGEIFYLPFTNSLALAFTPKKNKAKFMGYYSLAFSISHVLGPLIGLWVADTMGFQPLWIGCGILMMLVLLITRGLKRE